MEVGHVKLLTLLIMFPLVVSLIIMLVPRRYEGDVKFVAFVAAVIELILSLRLWYGIPEKGYAFVEQVAWVPAYGINYYLGVDGVSILLIILTTFLTTIAILASFKSIFLYEKEYYIAFLVLESAIIGSFSALNLVLFYIFWEMMLIPMVLIIGVWGSGNRIYAAVKFFLFTLVGSLLMLLALIYLGKLSLAQLGRVSFDLDDLLRLGIPVGVGKWLFAAFALAFAIKVPMFPVHTWLPDAHTEAPTAGSIILAGVLLKVGAYGFFRYGVPVYPDAAGALRWTFLILGLIAISYGAMLALVQKDLKRLIAYSSVSHMGFVVVGLFSSNQQAVDGAVMQMINHGLSTGALFLLVGMIYDRRHTRLIKDFGGLAAAIPLYSAAFVIVGLSSIGLPGLNGFIGEVLVVLGAFREHYLAGVFTAIGALLAASYMLWAIKRVFFGPITHDENRNLRDMSVREWVCVIPLIVLIVYLGLFPGRVLKIMKPATKHYLELAEFERTNWMAEHLKGIRFPAEESPHEHGGEGE